MIRKTRKLKKQKIEFPLSGYAGYAIMKFFDLSNSLSFLLDKLEVMMLINGLRRLTIEKPIYITSLARAGTTIILEMLSKHPDVATHQYKHLLMPYIPYWVHFISKNLPIYTKPIERIHKDGIMITRDSPEAVEEVFWQKFFNDIHNENTSNIISGTFSHPKFESFYKNHIKKLLISQKSSHYLAKNNYNITRLEYLLSIFPDSKFLLIIRNPVNHIASLIKQTNLFIKMEQEISFLQDWMRIAGHQEFGSHQVCINVGDTDLVHKIRKLWRNKKTYVKGWAYYWTSIYDFIANNLDANKKLKKATLIVNYDDLCETPAKIIDKILEHTDLSSKKFEKVKKYYVKYLHKPTYYTPNFSNQDLESIFKVTNETAARFGLKITKTT